MYCLIFGSTSHLQLADDSVPPKRDSWSNDWEFLMSCIAMSVGLGNVWRFPFVALENGGGAFLIPYLIVLFVIGRPIYYLEMLIGQFSSRGSVQLYDMAPAMRGMLVLTTWKYFKITSQRFYTLRNRLRSSISLIFDGVLLYVASGIGSALLHCIVS